MLWNLLSVWYVYSGLWRSRAIKPYLVEDERPLSMLSSTAEYMCFTEKELCMEYTCERFDSREYVYD